MGTIIFGAKGFVGRHLFDAYQELHPETLGTHHSLSPYITCNLAAPDLAALSIPYEKYQYGIISGAIPNIARCEKEPEISHQINVVGTLELAKQLQNRGITPVLFSTDYVFDGKEGNYTETSPLNPLNVYGKQKTLLEKLAPEILGSNYLLIRLGKVYSHQKGDRSLLDEMAAHLMKDEPIRVAVDQVFCPVAIEDIVKVIPILQEKERRGTYNVCGSQGWSRYAIAQAMVKALKKSPSLVQRIVLEDLGESFQRPKNTSLCSHLMIQETKIVPIPLEESIKRVADNYL